MDKRSFGGLLWVEDLLKDFYGQTTFRRSSFQKRHCEGLLQKTSNKQKTFFILRILNLLGVFYGYNIFWRSSIDRRHRGRLLQRTSYRLKIFCTPRIEDLLGVFYRYNLYWRSFMNKSFGLLDRRTFGGLLGKNIDFFFF